MDCRAGSHQPFPTAKPNQPVPGGWDGSRAVPPDTLHRYFRGMKRSLNLRPRVIIIIQHLSDETSSPRLWR